MTAVALQLVALATAPPIDVPTQPAGPSPTLRPDEADVVSLDFENYTDDQGNVVVIGQLQNTGHGPASEIQVTCEALDAAGVRIASGSDALLTLVGLPVGAKAPFQIRLSKPTGEVDKIHVGWTYKSYDPDAVHIFVPATGLSIDGQQFTEGLGSTPAQVSGQVKNGGSKGAAQVRVLASGYDDQGTLVDVEQGTPDQDTIPAGGTAAFTIKFSSRPDVQVVKVDLLPVGNEAP